MSVSVTQAIVEWLESSGIDAHANVPASRPDRFATVQRTGGGASNTLDAPAVAVQFWAQSDADAEDDANALRDHVVLNRRLVGCSGIDFVSVNAGPYPYPDPDSKQPRWQLVLDVVCRI